MSSGWSISLVGACLAICLVGCRLIDFVDQPNEPKNPLRPLTLADNGIALQLAHAQLPVGNNLEEVLWKHVDEGQFSPALRQRLNQNGIRAGVLGQLPDQIEAVILNYSKDQASLGSEPESSSDGLSKMTTTSRYLFLRPGKPALFHTAKLQDSIDLLQLNDNGQLTGSSYKSALGTMVLKGFPEPGERVRLRVEPELQHGSPRTQFISEPGLVGSIRPHSEREKVLFQALAMEAVLARGQMLVIGTQVDRVGTLGYHLFTAETPSGEREEKFILCRLAESKWDELFAKHTRVTDDSKKPK